MDDLGVPLFLEIRKCTYHSCLGYLLMCIDSNLICTTKKQTFAEAPFLCVCDGEDFIIKQFYLKKMNDSHLMFMIGGVGKNHLLLLVKNVL